VAKETKTQIEIAVAILNRLREHAELKSEITDVEVRRAQRHHPNAPNWDAIFEMVGYDNSGRPIPMPTTHPLALRIVEELQATSDLA
jgi:hypothetical protein